ncbi:hypothetical protein L484_001476 [Morus notabilis]|uniref:Uncharacterized protein n=1 Tax=Morus notabilis TaxID=981085 RepID=W9QZ71_9ROSA|nr:hypothetical protein L484_001476 [Morus notabilis]
MDELQNRVTSSSLVAFAFDTGNGGTLLGFRVSIGRRMLWGVISLVCGGGQRLKVVPHADVWASPKLFKSRS